MTASEMQSKQAELHEEIRMRAIELGYNPDDIGPIYDGVVDIEKYLKSSPRVMWILKEPYDGFDNDGNPCGGGWQILKDREATLSEMCNRNRTFRNLTYASFAIQDGLKYWDELPWIQDNNPEVADALLKVAYINVSKMPGKSTTDDKVLLQHYAAWRGVLFKQIDLYDPNVMIFCGTVTLRCFAQDMGLDLTQPERSESVVDIHNWRGRRVVWAPHPASPRVSPAQWVDSVVEAVRYN